MLKVVNNGISLTRGDTATFRLQIKNQDGTDYEITPDDQVLFTVKRSPNDEEIVIQKAAANNCITIVPRETDNLTCLLISKLLMLIRNICSLTTSHCRRMRKLQPSSTKLLYK